MIYKTDDDNLQVTVDYYPVDGAQIVVSQWDGEDFVTLYDKRVIAESLFEAVWTALAGADLDELRFEGWLADWGIEYPEDDED